ncbi:hypothetical protein BC830DRAFT_1094451 [Chytriomyces sp. MP71]|nr:hypothetical protein BC830DRAFT_1094451 [Chytriomyces sp. MP71]
MQETWGSMNRIGDVLHPTGEKSAIDVVALASLLPRSVHSGTLLLLHCENDNVVQYTWKFLFFVLAPDALLYMFSSTNDLSHTPLSALPVHHIEAQYDHSSDSWILKVTGEGQGRRRRWIIQMETNANCETWTSALETVPHRDKSLPLPDFSFIPSRSLSTALHDIDDPLFAKLMETPLLTAGAPDQDMAAPSSLGSIRSNLSAMGTLESHDAATTTTTSMQNLRVPGPPSITWGSYNSSRSASPVSGRASSSRRAGHGSEGGSSVARSQSPVRAFLSEIVGHVRKGSGQHSLAESSVPRRKGSKKSFKKQFSAAVDYDAL